MVYRQKEVIVAALMEQNRICQLHIAAQENKGILGNIYIGKDFSSSTGYNLAIEMIEKGNLPEAVFAANDSLAIGILKACHEKKVDVPATLSLFSINDIPAAEFMFPSLSTVHTNSEYLGVASIKLLLDKLHSKREFPIHMIIPSTLIFRDSCKK